MQIEYTQLRKLPSHYCSHNLYYLFLVRLIPKRKIRNNVIGINNGKFEGKNRA